MEKAKRGVSLVPSEKTGRHEGEKDWDNDAKQVQSQGIQETVH
jgi:hypothetical protein